MSSSTFTRGTAGQLLGESRSAAHGTPTKLLRSSRVLPPAERTASVITRISVPGPVEHPSLTWTARGGLGARGTRGIR